MLFVLSPLQEIFWLVTESKCDWIGYRLRCHWFWANQTAKIFLLTRFAARLKMQSSEQPWRKSRSAPSH